MPQGVSYFLRCKTGHRGGNSRGFGLCLSMCQRERQRAKEKKKLARQMTWLHHTTSLSLSFIKPLALSRSSFSYLPLTHTHTHTHTHTPAHRRSGADILGGVIPGVESLRSPCCDPVILGRGRVLEACRERKRLYIKNTFRPRGCVTAAIWLQIKRRCTCVVHVGMHECLCLHADVHMCTDVGALSACAKNRLDGLHQSFTGRWLTRTRNSRARREKRVVCHYILYFYSQTQI